MERDVVRGPLMAGALAAAMSKSLMNRKTPTARARQRLSVAVGRQVERLTDTQATRIGGCGAPSELHQAGLEALVGRRLPAARRLFERARDEAAEPDLLARGSTRAAPS